MYHMKYVLKKISLTKINLHQISFSFHEKNHIRSMGKELINNDMLKIINRISVSLIPGCILYVLGRNGTGKSTFFRCIMNLLYLISGNIDTNIQQYLRYSIKNWNHLNNFLSNVIHVDFSQLAHYSVSEEKNNNISTVLVESIYWMTLTSSIRNMSIEKIIHNFHTMEIDQFKNQLIRQLSLGQNKRIKLLKLLSIDKPLWILDEPFIGLDIKYISFLTSLMYLYKEKGGIILLATHQQLEIIDFYELNLDTK